MKEMASKKAQIQQSSQQQAPSQQPNLNNPIALNSIFTTL